VETNVISRGEAIIVREEEISSQAQGENVKMRGEKSSESRNSKLRMSWMKMRREIQASEM